MLASKLSLTHFRSKPSVRTVLCAVLLTIGSLSTANGGPSLFEIAKRDPLSLLPSMQDLLKNAETSAREEVGHDFVNNVINACNYSDEVLNKYRPHMYMVGLQEVARHDMQLAYDLAKAGYPEKVWRPALDGFTKANTRILQRQLVHRGSLDFYHIKTLMRPHEKALVRALEFYRKKSRRDLIEFSSAEVCGGDYIGFFNVRTSPPRGNLRIIREYFFQLCVAAKIDPYSINCDMWLTPAQKAEFPQGVYRYRVKWPEGPEECGKSEFTSNTEQIIAVAIEKTNKACER